MKKNKLLLLLILVLFLIGSTFLVGCDVPEEDFDMENDESPATQDPFIGFNDNLRTVEYPLLA